jgi:L-alanine-DL-glutamate epimerase-like enolase superfamily enzyme
MPVGESRRALAKTYEAYRKAFGDDMEMAIDFHARNYEPYRAEWFAQPIREYRPSSSRSPCAWRTSGRWRS